MYSDFHNPHDLFHYFPLKKSYIPSFFHPHKYTFSGHSFFMLNNAHSGPSTVVSKNDTATTATSSPIYGAVKGIFVAASISCSITTNERNQNAVPISAPGNAVHNTSRIRNAPIFFLLIPIVLSISTSFFLSFNVM